MLVAFESELKFFAGVLASYQFNNHAVHCYAAIASANFRLFLQALPVALVLHTTIERIAEALVN